MMFYRAAAECHCDLLRFLNNVCTGTSVVTVVATDADDPTYGNSARLVYSILQGQPYFYVEPKTGENTAYTPKHITSTVNTPEYSSTMFFICH